MALNEALCKLKNIQVAEKQEHYYNIVKLLNDDAEKTSEDTEKGHVKSLCDILLVNLKNETVDQPQLVKLFHAILQNKNLQKVFTDEEKIEVIKNIIIFIDFNHHENILVNCFSVLIQIISNFDLDVNILNDLLCRMEEVLSKKSDAISAYFIICSFFQKFIKDYENKLSSFISVYPKLVFLPLCHPSSKVREVAEKTLDMFPKLLLYTQDTEATNSLLKLVKESYSRDLLLLFKDKQELYVLKVWKHVVNALGNALPANLPTITPFFQVIEKGFKSPLDEVCTASFIAWKSLISSFADCKGVLNDTKRLRFIMKPFKNIARSNENILSAACDSWWHLAWSLAEHLSSRFSEVCIPLIDLTVGKISNEHSGKVSKPGPFSLMKKGCSIMLRFLEQPPCDTFNRISSPKKLPHILYPTLQSPIELKVIKNHFKEILVAFKTLIDVCGTKEDIKHHLESLMKSVLYVVSNSIDDSSKESVEVVTLYLNFLNDIIEAKTYPSLFCLKCIESLSKFSRKVLVSHNFNCGSRKSQDILCISIFKLLLNPHVFPSESSKRFSPTYNRLVQSGIQESLYPLQVSQKFMHVMRTTIGTNIVDTEALIDVWSGLATPLLEIVEKTQEVNQGDKQEHDFSCLYDVLIFPLEFILPVCTQQFRIRPALKLWTSLYKAFIRCASLVPTTNANEGLENFCFKLKSCLKEEAIQKPHFFESVCFFLQVIVESIDFASGNATGLINVALMAKRTKPLGNLSSFVDILCLLLKVYQTHFIEEDAFSQASAPAVQRKVHIVKNALPLDLVKSFFQNMKSGAIICTVLEQISDPLSKLFTVSSKKRNLSQIDAKLEIVWNVITSTIEHHYVSSYDSEFLAILSPLLETTFSHQKRNIKEKSRRFWFSTFGPNASSLKIPVSLKNLLKKMKLPLLNSFSVSPTESGLSSPTVYVPEDSIQDVTPTPVLLSAMEHVETPKALEVVNMDPPKTLPKEKAAAKISIEDLPSEEFVKIDTPVIMAHALKRRNFRKRKSYVPTLYNDLSQDISNSQDINSMSLSSDLHESSSPLEQPEFKEPQIENTMPVAEEKTLENNDTPVTIKTFSKSPMAANFQESLKNDQSETSKDIISTEYFVSCKDDPSTVKKINSVTNQNQLAKSTLDAVISENKTVSQRPKRITRLSLAFPTSSSQESRKKLSFQIQNKSSDEVVQLSDSDDIIPSSQGSTEYETSVKLSCNGNSSLNEGELQELFISNLNEEATQDLSPMICSSSKPIEKCVETLDIKNEEMMSSKVIDPESTQDVNCQQDGKKRKGTHTNDDNKLVVDQDIEIIEIKPIKSFIKSEVPEISEKWKLNSFTTDSYPEKSGKRRIEELKLLLDAAEDQQRASTEELVFENSDEFPLKNYNENTAPGTSSVKTRKASSIKSAVKATCLKKPVDLASNETYSQKLRKKAVSAASKVVLNSKKKRGLNKVSGSSKDKVDDIEKEMSIDIVSPDLPEVIEIISNDQKLKTEQEILNESNVKERINETTDSKDEITLLSLDLNTSLSETLKDVMLPVKPETKRKSLRQTQLRLIKSGKNTTEFYSSVPKSNVVVAKPSIKSNSRKCIGSPKKITEEIESGSTIPKDPKACRELSNVIPSEDVAVHVDSQYGNSVDTATSVTDVTNEESFEQSQTQSIELTENNHETSVAGNSASVNVMNYDVTSDNTNKEVAFESQSLMEGSKFSEYSQEYAGIHSANLEPEITLEKSKLGVSDETSLIKDNFKNKLVDIFNTVTDSKTIYSANTFDIDDVEATETPLLESQLMLNKLEENKSSVSLNILNEEVETNTILKNKVSNSQEVNQAKRPWNDIIEEINVSDKKTKHVHDSTLPVSDTNMTDSQSSKDIVTVESNDTNKLSAIKPQAIELPEKTNGGKLRKGKKKLLLGKTMKVKSLDDTFNKDMNKKLSNDKDTSVITEISKEIELKSVDEITSVHCSLNELERKPHKNSKDLIPELRDSNRKLRPKFTNHPVTVLDSKFSAKEANTYKEILDEINNGDSYKEILDGMTGLRNKNNHEEAGNVINEASQMDVNSKPDVRQELNSVTNVNNAKNSQDAESCEIFDGYSENSCKDVGDNDEADQNVTPFDAKSNLDSEKESIVCTLKSEAEPHKMNCSDESNINSSDENSNVVPSSLGSKNSCSIGSENSCSIGSENSCSIGSENSCSSPLLTENSSVDFLKISNVTTLSDSKNKEIFELDIKSNESDLVSVQFSDDDDDDTNQEIKNIVSAIVINTSQSMEASDLNSPTFKNSKSDSVLQFSISNVGEDKSTSRNVCGNSDDVLIKATKESSEKFSYKLRRKNTPTIKKLTLKSKKNKVSDKVIAISEMEIVDECEKLDSLQFITNEEFSIKPYNAILENRDSICMSSSSSSASSNLNGIVLNKFKEMEVDVNKEEKESDQTNAMQNISGTKDCNTDVVDDAQNEPNISKLENFIHTKLDNENKTSFISTLQNDSEPVDVNSIQNNPSKRDTCLDVQNGDFNMEVSKSSKEKFQIGTHEVKGILGTVENPEINLTYKSFKNKSSKNGDIVYYDNDINCVIKELVIYVEKLNYNFNEDDNVYKEYILNKDTNTIDESKNIDDCPSVLICAADKENHVISDVDKLAKGSKKRKNKAPIRSNFNIKQRGKTDTKPLNKVIKTINLPISNPEKLFKSILPRNNSFSNETMEKNVPKTIPIIVDPITEDETDENAPVIPCSSQALTIQKIDLSINELTDINTRLNASFAPQTRRSRLLAASHQNINDIETDVANSDAVIVCTEEPSSPLTSILKKRRAASPAESPPKIRRVTFASPLIQELVFERFNETKGIETIRMSNLQSLSSDKKRKKILQEKNKVLQSKIEKPVLVQLPAPSESEENVPSSSNYQDSDMPDNFDFPISPALINCPDSISTIIKDLTSPSWARGLETLLLSKNIKTIGDICKLNIHQLKALPIKPPAVTTLHRALTAYIMDTQESVLEKLKTVDELDIVDSSYSKLIGNAKEIGSEMTAAIDDSKFLDDTVKELLTTDKIGELPLSLLGELVKACGKTISERCTNS